MYLKTDGIVLRATDYNDSDKLLTVLTRDRGKLTLKARNVKSGKNPMKAACQLLSYSEFTVFENRGYLTVNEAVTKEMFLDLRSDLELLSLASYFAQVAEVVSQEDSPSPQILSLLLNSMYALGKLHKPQLLVKAAFELRIACLAGYSPELSGCAVCGNPTPDRFNVSHGILLCDTCSSEEFDGLRLPVSAGSLMALHFITKCDAKQLFSFQLSEETAQELSGLTETYLATQLERGFSTLDFYKSLFLQM
jgi:DNA repair protein RecO (recombination protein O)